MKKLTKQNTKRTILSAFLASLSYVLTRFVSNIGGQAVMEGLLMRNNRMYALAVRDQNNQIIVEKRPWIFITQSPFLKKAFVRGFPIILETLINGISALNRSAEYADSNNTSKISLTQIFFSLLTALFLAMVFFVMIPHFLSLFMFTFGASGNLDSLSFHAWDGIFKIALFVIYINCIAFIPEIKRVFQYHGAEHKVIACYENGGTVTAKKAKKYSRLHSRCGTVFLLFVLTIAILLHTLTVPFFVLWSEVSNDFTAHMVAILFKILLIIPISALAYELLSFTARQNNRFLTGILCTPGLFLQLLTTREPNLEQLEVAVIALKEAVDEEDRDKFETATYIILDDKYAKK